MYNLTRSLVSCQNFVLRTLVGLRFAFDTIYFYTTETTTIIAVKNIINMSHLKFDQDTTDIYNDSYFLGLRWLKGGGGGGGGEFHKI